MCGVCNVFDLVRICMTYVRFLYVCMIMYYYIICAARCHVTRVLLFTGITGSGDHVIGRLQMAHLNVLCLRFTPDSRDHEDWCSSKCCVAMVYIVSFGHN